MKRMVTIVGARPQFIKASAISKVIRVQFSNRIQEVLLHTGQHYDNNMSKVFFDELEIPAPAYNLSIGSNSHSVQTAAMLSGIEEILIKERPDAVLVYGDTNSTLAGALAASQLHIPVIHVEAGIRSFNKLMPEEINRITCDHLSTILFTPTESGIRNLKNENIVHKSDRDVNINNPIVFRCGDVMLDVATSALERLQSMDLVPLSLKNEQFILCTIHRDNNTDNPQRLNQLFKALLAVSDELKVDVVIPLHPRTRKMMQVHLEQGILTAIEQHDSIQILEPQSYLNTQHLLKHCAFVMTDSGGLQKEAYFHQKQVIVLRSETEWIELLEQDHAVVCDDNATKILETSKTFLETPVEVWPPYYGNGKAAEFICERILDHI